MRKMLDLKGILGAPLNADSGMESFEGTESNKISDFIVLNFSLEIPFFKTLQPPLPLRFYVYS